MNISQENADRVFKECVEAYETSREKIRNGEALRVPGFKKLRRVRPAPDSYIENIKANDAAGLGLSFMAILVALLANMQ